MCETNGLAYKIFEDRTGKHVANIYYNASTKEYSGKIVDMNARLPYIFNIYYDEKAKKVLPQIRMGGDPHPDSDVILFFLKDRVIPENRDMLKQILINSGVYEYDWRVLIRLNNGRSGDDSFSVQATESIEQLKLDEDMRT